MSHPFAVSSRFGTVEDFKNLIKKCHAFNILVIVDLVISHACSNTIDGIADMDGSGDQYFYKGIKGDHPAWGTKVFNTSKM